MANISPEHSKAILREMFKRVGITDELFESFDFTQPNWFHKHTWKQEEEDSFILWLATFLEKNKYCKKGAKDRHGGRLAEHESDKICMAYGWKVS